VFNRLYTFFRCRLRLTSWRPAFKIQLVDDFLVVFQIVELADLRGERVESTIGLLFLAAVASDAVRFDERRS